MTYTEPIFISKELKKKLMIYKISNSFKSINEVLEELLKIWLENLENKEKVNK